MPSVNKKTFRAKKTNHHNTTLEVYLKNIAKYPLISQREEIRLGKRIKEGDHEARNRLVEGNLRFVVCIAKKFSNNRLSLLDLINEGNIGLLEAAERFDPDKGFKFVTYAIWWIRQAILKALANQGFVVRLPLKKASLRQRIVRKEKSLKQRLARKPKFTEIADSLGENINSIENVIRATSVSISFEILTLTEENSSLKLLSKYSTMDSEDKIFSTILSQEIKSLFKNLSFREVEVLHLHLGLKNNGEKLTLEQIGKRFGMSKEGIRQIEKNATSKLRAHIA